MEEDVENLQVQKEAVFHGDPEVLTIRDNSRMDYDGKILSKRQWKQKTFFKDALKRFTVERKRNCALAGACPRARGGRGDHGPADKPFVDDRRWRENEFAFQFLTSFAFQGPTVNMEILRSG